MTSLLIAFIWNIVLLILKKMDEAQNPVADRTHYGAAGNDGYMDRVLIHSFIEKYYGSCSRRHAGWYISGSKFESYSQRL